MAGMEISVKKYVVRLSDEEREQLETLIRKGKGPARRLLKARILLKVDVSDAGDGCENRRPRLAPAGSGGGRPRGRGRDARLRPIEVQAD